MVVYYKHGLNLSEGQKSKISAAYMGVDIKNMLGVLYPQQFGALAPKKFFTTIFSKSLGVFGGFDDKLWRFLGVYILA